MIGAEATCNSKSFFEYIMKGIRTYHERSYFLPRKTLSVQRVPSLDAGSQKSEMSDGRHRRTLAPARTEIGNPISLAVAFQLKKPVSSPWPVL